MDATPPPDDADVDPLALAVLAALAGADAAGEPAMSVARLRKRLDARQSALARILSALADAGLVDVRDRQPGQPVAALTGEGLALARNLF